MNSPETNRILLALLLGAVAAGANLLGGVLVSHGKWSRQYLKYFIALGAGFMLATALVEMIPESVKLHGGSGSHFFNDANSVFVFVLAGYFVVHFFEHTVAPHFHFGEETHHEEMSHAHAGYAALLGLVIHTFFDGVAIASGLLVSPWLGAVIFLAIFLHKIPEGFTVASLMLASGQSRRVGVHFFGNSWRRDAGRDGIDVHVADYRGGRAAIFRGRYAVCCRVGPDPRGEPRARGRDGGAGFRWRCDTAGAEGAFSGLNLLHIKHREIDDSCERLNQRPTCNPSFNAFPR